MARSKAIPKQIPKSAEIVAKPEETAKAEKVKTKRRYRPGTVALREIRRYQKSTDLLIGKAPIERLIHDIDTDLHSIRHRFKRSAITAIHLSAEEYLQSLFKNTIKVALNSKSLTIRPQDMDIAKQMITS
jgi:histone H3